MDRHTVVEWETARPVRKQATDTPAERERQEQQQAKTARDLRHLEDCNRLQQAAIDTKAKAKTKTKAKAVPTVGLEPTTTRLRVLRSTN